MRNKKGWLRIVEAFVAILLIMIVGLVIVQRGKTQEQNVSEKIYEIEADILKEVFAKYTIDEIVDFEKLDDIGDYVDTRAPNTLQCEIQLCDINSNDCDDAINEIPEEYYTQSMPIIEKNQQFKIFCWIR
jgi:signal transduction histidine kinase